MDTFVYPNGGLRSGIDFGAFKVAVALQYVRPGGDARDTQRQKIVKPHFEGYLDELPNTLSQETVWEAGTNNFYYGREAVDACRKVHPGEEDGVAVGNDLPNLLGMQKEITRQFEFIREATLRSVEENNNEYLCGGDRPNIGPCITNFSSLCQSCGAQRLVVP
ncbi:hypothetical protein LTR95_008284 [Oleoguttula sp. CCFEE 5521]